MSNDLTNALAVGIGFRFEICNSIIANISAFDALEITVDHFLNATPLQRAIIHELAGTIPLVAHGVGLSLGTDIPPDKGYLKRVSSAIATLHSPWYSEHLAFTKVPGLDLAQLLPLPRNAMVAEKVINNIRAVQQQIDVPLLLENIAYYFDYPDSDLIEVEFLNLICGETNTSILLDVENLYVNACNHGYSAEAFIDAIPQGRVGAVHLAGGATVNNLLIDSHSQCIPDAALSLLRHVLGRHRPDTIILERDEHLDDVDEILADVRRIRAEVNTFRTWT